MNFNTKYKNTEILTIFKSLLKSSETIYKELKSGAGLEFLNTTNESNDEQLGLDVFADECFQENANNETNIKYILSEERPDLVQYGSGKYSLTLDPLDGSKSAIVGIPSGAIFGVFEEANNISDFNGKNIVSGGFFVFGINLEVYFSINDEAYKGVFNNKNSTWDFVGLENLPKYKMFAINTSNKIKWDKWLQDFYDDLVNQEDDKGKRFNMRWYASMVSEIKRLIIQGGLFSYPNDSREGYSNGHLRLVYEAIPMAYLIKSVGGSSTNGQKCILDVEVSELHQKTPVFIGDKDLIKQIESLKK
jgi:fructose-1,6-bisphosphatase I